LLGVVVRHERVEDLTDVAAVAGFFEAGEETLHPLVVHDDEVDSAGHTSASCGERVG
jgi:hypothetical protein